jgi:tRNA-dihydrouridine synthase
MSVKRPITIKIRLTDEEKELLEQRMQDTGIQNREAYLRKMALTGYILRLDMSEVRETLRLLANATNNINQIAMRANETRSIYANDMIKLREEVGNLRSQVSDAMKVFSKVRKYLEL